jgi:hypothetical protein
VVKRFLSHKYRMQLREIDPRLARDLEGEPVPEPILQRHGYTVIGSGMQGAVAEKPGAPWVLKVFTARSPYRHFVEYAIKHQGNPHVPRFYSERDAHSAAGEPGGGDRVLIPLGRSYLGVHMERLKHAGWNTMLFMFRPELYSLFLVAYASGLRAYRREPQRDIEKRIIKLADLQPDHVENLGKFAKNTDEWSQLWEKTRRAPDEAWLSLVQDLVAHSGGSRGASMLDLNEDNLMLRGNTLVITDPYA